MGISFLDIILLKFHVFYYVLFEAQSEENPDAATSTTSTTVGHADKCCPDVKEDLKNKFKVQMPQDFFDFWEFCKDINQKCPSGQFTVL